MTNPEPEPIGGPISDEEKYLAYGRALRDSVADAFDPWLIGTLRARIGGEELHEDLIAAVGEIRSAALANLTTLIEADVTEPLSGPLEQIRRAVVELGPLLDTHGFSRPTRDPYDQEMRPEDVHALGPISFMDLGEGVQTAGITWGAAKAHLHMSRRG